MAGKLQSCWKSAVSPTPSSQLISAVETNYPRPFLGFAQRADAGDSRSRACEWRRTDHNLRIGCHHDVSRRKDPKVLAARTSSQVRGLPMDPMAAMSAALLELS